MQEKDLILEQHLEKNLKEEGRKRKTGKDGKKVKKDSQGERTKDGM
jgi:hypothetical protein